jgi:hypothetical protein
MTLRNECEKDARDFIGSDSPSALPGYEDCKQLADLLERRAKAFAEEERERIIEIVRGPPIVMDGAQGSIGNTKHLERKRILEAIKAAEAGE